MVTWKNVIPWLTPAETWLTAEGTYLGASFPLQRSGICDWKKKKKSFAPGRAQSCGSSRLAQGQQGEWQWPPTPLSGFSLVYIWHKNWGFKIALLQVPCDSSLDPDSTKGLISEAKKKEDLLLRWLPKAASCSTNLPLKMQNLLGKAAAFSPLNDWVLLGIFFFLNKDHLPAPKVFSWEANENSKDIISPEPLP